MGRPPRLDPPDSWHHVWGRGIGKRAVFETRRDARRFLAAIARSVRRGEIELHGFVCMTNHFHLLVRSRNGLLSEALRRILNEYSHYFNRTRDRDGTIWRGRFSSRIVDSNSDARVVLRYIDRNPVAAGMVRSPDEYAYGSATRFAKDRVPPWLELEWVDSEVQRACGRRIRDGGRYESAFPFDMPPAMARLAEARQRTRALDTDDLDNLLAASPSGVQQWFAKRAISADASKPFRPVVDAETVLLQVDTFGASRGDFIVHPRRQGRSALLFLRVTLLRVLSGETQAQIARRLRLSKATVHAVLNDHPNVAAKDVRYLGAVDELTRAALSSCFPAGSFEQTGRTTSAQACLTPE